MQGNKINPMKTSILLLGIFSLLHPVFASETASGSHFKIIQTTTPVYPVRMANEGVSHGQTKVVLHVNSKGQLADFLVVAYTKQAFAEETERAIQTWKFEPEFAGGEPIDTIMTITFNFEVNGVMMVSRYGGFNPYNDYVGVGSYDYQACSLKNLDSIPTPVSVVPPVYYKDLADKGIAGKVVVDFYIDETGKTRFVATPTGSNELLAGISVAAVQKWQFAPPTRKGKPVLVHAQQVFDFRKENASVN
jgi:TonB family protein